MDLAAAMDLSVAKSKRTIRKYPTRVRPAKKRTAPLLPDRGPLKRSSAFRGVTRHRWTGRFEAHLWDKSSWNENQMKKGRQVYLGAYDEEEAAAKAYDLAALKYWGPGTLINFKLEEYEEQLLEMANITREEYLATLRRRSSGFSRGVSKYRGVARHHHNGRWEARIGRVDGNKYLYLGTFGTQEEAARAYDLAAIEFRGAAAVTNFDLTCYTQELTSLPAQPSSTKRYTRDGASSNNLENLDKQRSISRHTCLQRTGDTQNSTETSVESSSCCNRADDDDAGFTWKELSEIETSGSSSVTSLMEPKVEEEYDWSQYTSFEVNLEDYLDEESSESQCRLAGNYSLWNCNVFQDVVHEPPDHSTFISNVLGEAELPSMQREYTTISTAFST